MRSIALRLRKCLLPRKRAEPRRAVEQANIFSAHPAVSFSRSCPSSMMCLRKDFAAPAVFNARRSSPVVAGRFAFGLQGGLPNPGDFVEASAPLLHTISG